MIGTQLYGTDFVGPVKIKMFLTNFAFRLLTGAPGSTNYAIVPFRTLQNQLKLCETFKAFAPRNSDFQRTSSSSRSLELTELRETPNSGSSLKHLDGVNNVRRSQRGKHFASAHLNSESIIRVTKQPTEASSNLSNCPVTTEGFKKDVIQRTRQPIRSGMIPSAKTSPQRKKTRTQ
ncbi:hypothetical protein M9458_055062, partial [Cirrhinus mrigala]